MPIQVWGGGGDRVGLNFPLPVPFKPSFCPTFVSSRSFALLRLQNTAQCCIIDLSLFFLLPNTLGIPLSISAFLVSHLPYASYPLISHAHAPLSPSTLNQKARTKTCNNFKCQMQKIAKSSVSLAKYWLKKLQVHEFFRLTMPYFFLE